MARQTQAMPTGGIPRILALTSTAVPTFPALDVLQEWKAHVDYVPKLLPVEILIMLCLIWLFLLKVGKIWAKRHWTNPQTTLKLEIGNGTQSVLLAIKNLSQPPSCYRFISNKNDTQIHLIKKMLYADFHWGGGLVILNDQCEFLVHFPRTLPVSYTHLTLPTKRIV